MFNFSKKDNDLSIAASHLMNNEAFKEAIEVIDDELKKGWLNTKVSETDLREKYYFATKSLYKVVNLLDGYMQYGESYKKSIQNNVKKG